MCFKEIFDYLFLLDSDELSIDFVLIYKDHAFKYGNIYSHNFSTIIECFIFLANAIVLSVCDHSTDQDVLDRIDLHINTFNNHLRFVIFERGTGENLFQSCPQN